MGSQTSCDEQTPPSSITEYKFLKKLGRGAYGNVYLAEINGTKVAIKATKTSSNKAITSDFIREVSILNSLDNINIVAVQNSFVDDNFSYLVIPHAGKPLSSLSRDNDTNIKSFLFQILSGIQHVHDHGFIHRDLCSSNLLVKDGILTIIDFGISCRTNSHNKSSEVVTIWYRAPELLLMNTASGEYGNEIDIWSIGCVFAEMLSEGTPLFQGRTKEQMLTKINHSKWKQVLGDKLEANEYNLLLQMLCPDPLKRITAKEALEHEYFYLEGGSI